MYSDVNSAYREPLSLLTCPLVDVNAALPLPALDVPGVAADDVERAGIQVSDGQIGVCGVQCDLVGGIDLVQGHGVEDSVVHRVPGHDDAVVAGRRGGEMDRRQN